MKAMNEERFVSDYGKFVETTKESVDRMLSKDYLMKSSPDYTSTPDYTKAVEDSRLIEDAVRSALPDNTVRGDLIKLTHSILPEELSARDSIKSESRDLDLFLLSSRAPFSEDVAPSSDVSSSTSPSNRECGCNEGCCKDLADVIHDVFNDIGHWFG